MHEPRPYGLFVRSAGDSSEGKPAPELSTEDASAVESLARNLTNHKDLSGFYSAKKVMTLPGGGTAIAVSVGGTMRVIVTQPEKKPIAVPYVMNRAHVPMLYSGVVTKAMLEENEGAGLLITETTRRRLVAYASEAPLPPSSMALQRFRIPYHAQVSELGPQGETNVFYTQYVAQRPTWYSGAMAKLIQIVGGYGIQDMGKLPKSERITLAIPDNFAEQIQAELRALVRLPGYTGAAPLSGQFQFDYKFENTHGVAFDDDKKPWLILVSQLKAGVFAMPLPLIPATTTKAFRKYIESVKDDEILSILDLFGGMPSGEGFPSSGADFQAWRRAGVIIKICDVSDFYTHIAYATSCGWAFSASGQEGFNTCYDYGEDGIAYGLAYKLKLSIPSIKDSGRQSKVERVPNAEVDFYVNCVFAALKNTQEGTAAKYKIHRAKISEVEGRAHGFDMRDAQAEADYWSNREDTPITPITGSVTRTSKGSLYHPAKFLFQPQIKFPEPYMGGCISFDFSPQMEGRGKSNYPKCDTIMFGYFIGDQLKVVKYFWDPRSKKAEIEDDYEECMIVGSWTRTETTSDSFITGNFYTTDFDARALDAEQKTVTRIKGKDMGWCKQPFFSFDGFFVRPGHMWRSRYFSHTTDIETRLSHAKSIGVCIPYLHRNALLHAWTETSLYRTTHSTAQHSVTDPTTYRFWTNDFVFHWREFLPVMRGSPWPKDSSPCWVEMEEYAPGECTDFADQGSWIHGLPADYTWLIHPKAGENKTSGGGGAPSFTAEYSTKEKSDGAKSLDISIVEVPQSVSKTPDSWYFSGSPDENGNIFYVGATMVCMGESEYSVCSESDGERKKHWGYTRLANHKSCPQFLGVINE